MTVEELDVYLQELINEDRGHYSIILDDGYFSSLMKESIEIDDGRETIILL